MARWKLMTPHYLNVEDETWEYSETDRTTGRPVRRKFNVPRLLDPRDPGCWNVSWGNKDNQEGEIIVCHKDKGEARDVVFFGDPTPDMVPVDEEAREISAAFEKKWAAKPEDMAGTYSQSIIDKFQVEMAAAQAKPAEIPGLADLTAVLAKVVDQNAKLMADRRV